MRLQMLALRALQEGPVIAAEKEKLLDCIALVGCKVNEESCME